MLLDVAKTFNKVWIHKLIHDGMDSALVRLITSFPSNKKFRVKLDGARLTVTPIVAGGAQSSVPVLTPTAQFMLYADENHDNYKQVTRRPRRA